MNKIRYLGNIKRIRDNIHFFILQIFSVLNSSIKDDWQFLSPSLQQNGALAQNLTFQKKENRRWSFAVNCGH